MMWAVLIMGGVSAVVNVCLLIQSSKELKRTKEYYGID